jgi:hypothetical protein
MLSAPYRSVPTGNSVTWRLFAQLHMYSNHSKLPSFHLSHILHMMVLYFQINEFYMSKYLRYEWKRSGILPHVSVIFRDSFVCAGALLTTSAVVFFLQYFSLLWGWDWVHLVLRPLFGLLYQSRVIRWWMWSSRWNANWQRKPSTQRKPAPVPLCSP